MNNDEPNPIPTLLSDLALELTLLTMETFTAQIWENGEYRLKGTTCTITAYLRTWPRPYRLVFWPTGEPPVKSYRTTQDIEITCDPARTPASLARDIRNRLLENARAWTVKNLEYHASEMKRQAIHEAASLELLNAGLTAATWQEGMFYMPDVKATLYSGQVTLEIRSLPAHQVKLIIDLLNEERMKKP